MNDDLDLQSVLSFLDNLDGDDRADTALLPIENAPEAFEQNTLLALQVVRRILALNPKPHDEHYEAVLRAQTQLATSQLVAQLRLSEARLKAPTVERDFYAELSEALARYRAGLQ